VTAAPVSLEMYNCKKFALWPSGKVTQYSVPWLEIPAQALGGMLEKQRAKTARVKKRYRVEGWNRMRILTAKKV